MTLISLPKLLFSSHHVFYSTAHSTMGQFGKKFPKIIFWANIIGLDLPFTNIPKKMSNSLPVPRYSTSKLQCWTFSYDIQKILTGHCHNEFFSNFFYLVAIISSFTRWYKYNALPFKKLEKKLIFYKTYYHDLYPFV